MEEAPFLEMIREEEVEETQQNGAGFKLICPLGPTTQDKKPAASFSFAANKTDSKPLFETSDKPFQFGGQAVQQTMDVKVDENAKFKVDSGAVVFGG